MPRFTTPDGCTLEYRLRGDGPLIALTPGGREGGEVVAPLADALARSACVLSWDRRNCGASDVFCGGDSEQELWADDLAELLRHLGRGPAWIAGGSAGCRVSVLTVLRHPEVARGLVVWSASGSAYSCQFLGFSYHVPYIVAAQGGGMDAVAATPFFAERIVSNPVNRERLLGLDPEEFVATMKRWNRSFYHRSEFTLAAVADADLSTIRLPTLIIAGNDDIHPAEVSERMAELIAGSKLLPSAWSTAEFMDLFTGRISGSVFDLYPRLAEPILGFIAGASV